MLLRELSIAGMGTDEAGMEAVDQGFLEVPGTNGGLLKKIIREVGRAALIRVPRCAEACSCDGACVCHEKYNTGRR